MPLGNSRASEFMAVPAGCPLEGKVHSRAPPRPIAQAIQVPSAVSMRPGSSTRFIEFLLPGAGYKAGDEIRINVMMMSRWIFVENQFSGGVQREAISAALANAL